MSYLVLAYPNISETDYQFIQDYRKKYDPKYFSIVEPHFTIVFSTSNLTENEFIAEVEKQSQGIKKFDFKIRCATTNQDDSKDFYHEFLVPDEGYSNIVKLHDKLYSGIFFDNLRFDIDFIPHIGIGNDEDVFVCKKRIDELNAKDLLVEGSVQVIDIVKYADHQISTIKKVTLI